MDDPHDSTWYEHRDEPPRKKPGMFSHWTHAIPFALFGIAVWIAAVIGVYCIAN